MRFLNTISGHTCVCPSELMSEVHELTSIDGVITEDAIHELRGIYKYTKRFSIINDSPFGNPACQNIKTRILLLPVITP